MAQVKVFGYSDKLSLKVGEEVQIHVSADGTDTVDAQLVRLIHGDEHPDGPGFIEEEVDCEANGVWDVEKQFTQVGSFLEVEDPAKTLALDGSITLHAFIWPRTPEIGHRQCILGRWDNRRNFGYCLGINRTGRLEFWVGRGDEIDYVEAEVPLQEQVWYFVAATFDTKTGKATLYQEGVPNRYNSRLGRVTPIDYRSHVSEVFRFRQKNLDETPFLMAGSRDWHELRGDFVSQLYCGKIDRCGVYDRALGRAELDGLRQGGEPPAEGLVAYWDTTVGYTDRGIGDEVVDTGPNRLNAYGYNRPVRAMTGWNWTARNDCFRLAPEQYGGIEFHDDAVIDSNWKVTAKFKLPEKIRSGAYAMRLRSGDGTGLAEEYVVFFVRPKKPTGRIAFLFSTATYLAYANERFALDGSIVQPMGGQPPTITEPDIEMYKNPEFGLGAYDHHADGAGVCYTGYHRPLLNMRPKYRISAFGMPWNFPADLSVVAWLEHKGYDYDILTDEDIHYEGAAAMAPYNCVLNSTHPEYYSENMMDATEDYIAGGGRYICVGANSFCCNVAFRDDDPTVMECRKVGGHWKAWLAQPGEYHMATTGQMGGLWNKIARYGQKIAGVTMAGEGFAHSRPYELMPDAFDPELAWITKGIEPGELIGNFGLGNGGAAGIELDRYHLDFGTPPDTKVIASSGGHPDNYVAMDEEGAYAHQGFSGTHNHELRGDFTFCPSHNGGAVVATGSIAFGMALPINNFDNNVSTLLGNVVDAFAEPGPLPGAKEKVAVAAE
ncbi:N,N-dimethylformamidase beta subunit family domain-containing protein [Methyloligella sp. 2.7D]|uniref:N,N-dimethylformamidase beta subunit family domain-containing protein n=1 Tax=unclassified Methyloligella TaxID=2625955 RepID=UPI00157CF56E|nr:N,N-dimethylformamidase beta subunit family domain-containing protein [Methyloligella sp. GL2]QKP78235.1 LamG domain-containing protein [Methyloligella sp. GL2]